MPGQTLPRDELTGEPFLLDAADRCREPTMVEIGELEHCSKKVAVALVAARLLALLCS